MNIFILKGESQNNVLRVFADAIASALAQSGSSVELIDLIEKTGVSRFNALMKSNELFGILSFNGILGEFLPNNFQPIFISWLVDSPHYHYKRIRNIDANPNRHIIAPSRHHLNFIRQAGIKAKTSVMLAGARAHSNIKPDTSRRDSTVTLAASWMGEPEKFWEQLTDSVAKTIAQRAVEILDADPIVDVFSAMSKAANLSGVKLELNEAWMQIACMVQNFVRQKDRLRAVNALRKSGIPFTLIGRGWDKYISNSDNVKYISDVDNKFIQEFYKNSKIVINLNASNGACERFFDAAAAGACVVTDYSSSIDELFKDGKDFRFYDRRKPDTIIDAIESSLANDKYINMANRLDSKLISEHTWGSRASLIRKIFESNKPNKS